MFIQDVNHAVAKAPQQEQRGDQRKGDEEVFAVGGLEKTAALAVGLGELWSRCHVVAWFG